MHTLAMHSITLHITLLQLHLLTHHVLAIHSLTVQLLSSQCLVGQLKFADDAVLYMCPSMGQLVHVDTVYNGTPHALSMMYWN